MHETSTVALVSVVTYVLGALTPRAVQLFNTFVAGRVAVIKAKSEARAAEVKAHADSEQVVIDAQGRQRQERADSMADFMREMRDWTMARLEAKDKEVDTKVREVMERAAEGTKKRDLQIAKLSVENEQRIAQSREEARKQVEEVRRETDAKLAECEQHRQDCERRQEEMARELRLVKQEVKVIKQGSDEQKEHK